MEKFLPNEQMLLVVAVHIRKDVEYIPKKEVTSNYI